MILKLEGQHVNCGFQGAFIEVLNLESTGGKGARLYR